ncbi:MAG: OmpA family protein [Bacteroidota bacterium]
MCSLKEFFKLPVLVILFLLLGTLEHTAYAQYKRFKSKSQIASRKKYNSTFASKQCFLLYKNRVKTPKTKKTKNKKYEVAESDTPSDRFAYYKKASVKRPQDKPKPEPDFHDKTFADQTLDERHTIEDEVLVKNNLPKPTSEKHERIRKLVSERIKDKKDDQPLKLEPLYFVTDQDEFAFVDMDPFLVAVEYALQGRMVLIEGHTDNRGNDNYNVDLSIKRVQRIRQLMKDIGVPDDRISVIGYGEEIATHDNQTNKGRQRNRRVDFTVF